MKYRLAHSAVAMALLAAAWTTPATAEGGRVDQLEFLDIEAGESEAEIQYIFADAGPGTDHALGLTLEFGVNDRLELGVEIGGEKEAGEAFAIEELVFQAKWAAIEPRERTLGLGIQGGLVLATDSGEVGAEMIAIIQHGLGEDAAVAANLTVEAEPGDWSDRAVSYGVRLNKSLSEQLELGLESGGTLDGDGRGSHFIGPVLAFATGEGDGSPTIELSAFAPLSREAPGFQARVEIDFAF
jgi:hypothetical protein